MNQPINSASVYALHESGKHYIAERIDFLAKDFCMPTGWHEEAIQAANVSDDFRNNVTITIPADLSISGKPVVIKLRRSHFIHAKEQHSLTKPSIPRPIIIEWIARFLRW